MPDLQKTDAQWLAFTSKEGHGMRVKRYLEDVRRRFFRNRDQAVYQGPLTALAFPDPDNTFTGLVTLGPNRNTDENGDLWLRITGASPTATVSLYMATGAGAPDLVAEATGNVADGAVAVLTEQNSSGLTATLQMPATLVNITSDDAKLRVLQDFSREHPVLWDGTSEDDVHSIQAATTMLNTIVDQLDGALSAVDTFMTQSLISGPDNPRAEGNEFLKADETTLFDESEITDGSGNVAQGIDGLFVVQSQAMEAETLGNTQDIAERVVARTAGVFEAGNTGQFTLAAGTAEQRALLAEVTLAVEEGVGTGAGGVETWSGSAVATKSDETVVISGVNTKKLHELPRGMGTIQILRSFTKVGDGTNVLIGPASSFSMNGETEANTDAGQVYPFLVANGPNFDYEFYRQSNFAIGSLVAKASAVAASATSVVATSQNGSGLEITFDAGTAPVAGDPGVTINANFGVVADPLNNEPADSVRFSTTLTSEGIAARILAELFEAEWNAITAGSEQLPDGPLGVVGTFPDYVAADI